MAKKENTEPNADAAVSARVEAVGKASYSRKRTTTEIIPADVTRAKAGAWLDLISPLTEWAGLKGDELRTRREQLRLQREDVLSEIALRFRERIGPRHLESKPIPVKFLVPYLEQASLEDPESSLVDLWADLLVSASKEFNSYHTYFVGVIARISAKQGDILERIVGTNDLSVLELGMDDISAFLGSSTIQQRFKILVRKMGKQASDDDLADLIYEEMGGPGVSIVHSAVENLKTGRYFDLDFDYRTYEDGDAVDCSILEAVGLIRRVDTDFFNISKWSMTLHYYHLTDLGFHFAKACRIAE